MQKTATPTVAIARISYGNSVRLSIGQDPVPFQDQLR